jgi:hypothetical protein
MANDSEDRGRSTHDVAEVPRIHDTSSSINRLPRELLAFIFLLLLPDWWRHSRDFEQFLGLSHVCSLWRKIATETSNLWGTLPCPTPAQTALALKRVRDAPRNITLIDDYFDTEATLESALEVVDMSRVQELNFSC